jgi:hypothetical protein
MLLAGLLLIALSVFDVVLSIVLAGRSPQAAQVLRASALVTLVIGAVLAILGAA